MTFGAPVRAVMRPVPDSYARCLRTDPAEVDPARARAQVEEMARHLESLGVQVDWAPADEAYPDGCFVEDPAVVLTHELAVATTPGAPSRRGEVSSIRAALERRVARVVPLEDPEATLDGGDVLRVDRTLFVGATARTNQAGIAALGRIAATVGLEVRAVPIEAGLHLKSVVTLLAPGQLVALRGALDLGPFRGLEVLETVEPAGANVLALGPVVLVSSAAPETAGWLGRLPGVEVRVVEATELHKGDGALTCVSLRIPPAGGWCS